MVSLPVAQHSSTFAALPQISRAELAQIAAAGFKSVINNRPDGEGGPSQPMSEDLRLAAEAHGLRYAHLPVVSGHITADQVARFRDLLAQLPQPVVAFCRTGTRSAALYKMAFAAGFGPTNT